MIKIKAIVFDYGGVISQPQDKKMVNKICKVLNISEDHYKSIYQKVRKDYDSGIITGYQYWNEAIDANNINKLQKKDIDKLINYDVLSWIKTNQKVVNFIKTIKKSNIKLAILSNMTYDTLNYLKIKSKWLKYFNYKIFSCEEKKCKPDKEIYEITLDRINGKANDTLFIDDSINNIFVAKDIGFNTIHYINDDNMINDINEKYRWD